MTSTYLPNNWKFRSRVVSGIFRALTLSLLIAAVSFIQAQAQTMAYVVNSQSNSVSVIDTTTNTVTATIPVGNIPVGVAVTPDGSRAYVSNSQDGTLSVVDTSSNTVTATISLPAGSRPAFTAITPDGRNLYVPDGVGNVLVVNTATNTVSTTIPNPSGSPAAVAMAPNGATAYVLTFVNSVSLIDTATNTIVGSPIPVQWAFFAPLPSIAVTPAGNAVYVAGGVFDVVSAISTATDTVSATVPITGAPLIIGVAITPDGAKAYVTAVQVFIIDTATNTLEPTAIAVGNTPAGVAITPNGAFVYVANNADGTVSVIDTSANTVTATIPVGSAPFGITIANLNAPFSQFAIKGLTINNNGFTEAGDLTLGASSQGLDLAHQPLTLTVNGFSLTIPAGSFKQVGGNMHFVFNGTINGLSVSMTLAADKGTSTQFKYSVTVTGVNLSGGPNPATVGLNIGENTGTTTAPF